MAEKTQNIANHNYFSNIDSPLFNLLTIWEGVLVRENVSSISYIYECSLIILNFVDPDRKLVCVLFWDVTKDALKTLSDPFLNERIVIFYLLILIGSI